MLRNLSRIYNFVHPNIHSTLPNQKWLLEGVTRFYEKSADQFIHLDHVNLCSINALNNYCSRYFSSQSSHIVQMRGLDMDTKEKDVIEFFKPLGIIPIAVHLKCDGSGRVAGVTEVEFATHADAVVAMRKKNSFIGNRFVRLAIKSSDLDLDQFKKFDVTKTEQKTGNKEFQISATTDGSYYTGHVIKMKNVPRRMTDQAIHEFFWPIGVSPVSVKAMYNESGIRTGEFEVQFLTKNDVIRAMAKNNSYLGKKFVEISVPKS